MPGSSLKKFRSSAKNSVTKPKLEKKVSITYFVELVKTNPLMHNIRRGTSQNLILNFKKKIKFLGLHAVASTCEDLSIDVLITNVGLILTKLRWFQLFVTSQNSNFKLCEKKIKVLTFHGVASTDDLSIHVSITNAGLILTKLRWIQLFVTSQNSNFRH